MSGAPSPRTHSGKSGADCRCEYSTANSRDGSTVLLFYNNGHTDKLGYCGRLVVWVMLGRPQGAGVSWTQPELAIWWDGCGW